MNIFLRREAREVLQFFSRPKQYEMKHYFSKETFCVAAPTNLRSFDQIIQCRRTVLNVFLGKII